MRYKSSNAFKLHGPFELQIAIDKCQRNDDKTGYTSDIDRMIPAEGVPYRKEMSHCPETDLEDFINQELLVLPYTLNIPQVLRVLH